MLTTYAHVITNSSPKIIIQAEANNAQYQLSMYLPIIYNAFYQQRLEMWLAANEKPTGTDYTVRTTSATKIGAFIATESALGMRNVHMARCQPVLREGTGTWEMVPLNDISDYALFNQLSRITHTTSKTGSIVISGKHGGARDDIAISFMLALYIGEMYKRPVKTGIEFGRVRQVEKNKNKEWVVDTPLT